MIQGSTRLFELITCYKVVDPFVKENLRDVNIDLRLGATLKVYTKDIDLLKPVETEKIEMDEKGYILKPGAFVLGSTFEKVIIPIGYFGFIETKGNISRAGISSHNSDGHIDPGFSGNITLEIRNNADVNIIIYPGIKFVQLSLWRIEGESTMYSGHYQNSEGPTAYRPDYKIGIIEKEKAIDKTIFEA